MKTNPAKTISWKAAILLFLGAGLITVGLSVFLQTEKSSITQILFSESSLAETAPATIVSGFSFETPAQPSRLIILKIKVDAKIQAVGETSKGEMDIPTNISDVAWYGKGVIPGMPGSAVIAGHLNGRNTPNGVFRNISNLQIGDLVEIRDKSGKEFQFQVTAIKIYDYNAPTAEVFTGDGKPRLNLITCAGDWIKSIKLYNKRLVVFTELVIQK